MHIGPLPTEYGFCTSERACRRPVEGSIVNAEIELLVVEVFVFVVEWFST
jgi:hypothetical protein